MFMKSGTFAKKAPASIFLLALGFTISLSSALGPPAQAAPANKTNANEVKLSYDVHGAGFKLMTVDIDIMLNGNKYAAKSDLKTVGFAKLFTAIKAKYEANGTFSKTRFKPAHFTMETKKKKKRRSSTVSWNKRGMPKMAAKPPIKEGREKAVLKTLRTGMPDPLTTMLTLMLNGGKSPCKLTRLVLDGRKIFELKVSYSKQVEVKSKDSKLYQGKAFHCIIKDRPVAGYSKKTMAKIITKPKPPFNIWLVPVTEQSLKRNFLVPLFVTGPTNFADITVRLTKALINGKSLKSLSLASN